ncbi:MAG TPA: FAD-dependent oxidoreductase [Saprospiraceae bacterium]|jgi:NADPH-dependent 2,4-dienoyl-CoA reductase/sulfur reductase-like enzyme/rhodanese-related sulfurtransferase|nr:FAD-dependent oxidoreductase [Saprospiraceae bacterium]
MKKKRIIVIGGSAAGPKAASRARRLDENAEITIIQKAPDLSMASCGYPYYVAGVFDDRNQLLATPAGLVRDANFFWDAKRIKALVNTEVTKIDRDNKNVEYKNLLTGETASLPYDKLVIATGATPFKPPVPGIDLKGVTTLQSMADSDFLRRIGDEGEVKNAVVIGGGLIGIETCEALVLSDIEVTLVELLPQLLPFLDKDMSLNVKKYLKTKANVILENGVSEFIGENGKLKAVKLQDGTIIPCEIAVVATGVRPNINLAKEAGLKIGECRAIEVNSYMQTSDPDIYAIGDCIEIPHLISGKKVHAPLGDLANLQGRVAGDNVIKGNVSQFPGTIQSGICKVFDYGVGAAGLSQQGAVRHGFENIETVINVSPDKPGFMGANILITKLVVDKNTNRILGAQVLGPGDVSKQVTTWAMAIQAKMTVEDMLNLDLPYAPPYSLAIDHSIATAHIMQNKLDGLFVGITPTELKEKLERKDPMFLMDLRNPGEFEVMKIGIGEKLIPQWEFRDRWDELPKDKNAEIIAWCKISLRGYEAVRALMQYGYKNVKLLEGGVLGWPW